MATIELTIRGDQIGSYLSLSATGNGVDRVVTLHDVQSLGSASDTYRIVVEQVNAGVTQFANGQFITIYDSLDNIVVPKTSVQNDAEQGLGAGDEHLIIGPYNIVIDVGGLPLTPTDVLYAFVDEAATPTIGDNDGELDFVDTAADFPCFDTGSMIATPGRPRPVETLQTGDLVLTQDGTAQPILWIGTEKVDFSRDRTRHRPILIRAGALGPGSPDADLTLSPQHRVFQRHDDRKWLLPAKGLVGLRGVRVKNGCNSATYHSILLPMHRVIFANGLPVESFYPGRYMMTALAPRHRAAIRRSHPAFGATGKYGPTAWPVLTVRQAQRFMAPLRAGALAGPIPLLQSA